MNKQSQYTVLYLEIVILLHRCFPCWETDEAYIPRESWGVLVFQLSEDPINPCCRKTTFSPWICVLDLCPSSFAEWVGSSSILRSPSWGESEFGGMGSWVRLALALWLAFFLWVQIFCVFCLLSPEFFFLFSLLVMQELKVRSWLNIRACEKGKTVWYVEYNIQFQSK